MKRKSRPPHKSRMTLLACLPGAWRIPGGAGSAGLRRPSAMGSAASGRRARYGPSGGLPGAVVRTARNCHASRIGHSGRRANQSPLRLMRHRRVPSRIARAAHAASAPAWLQVARTGYFASDAGEHLFDPARQRAVATCMVEVASRRDGAVAWHARDHGRGGAQDRGAPAGRGRGGGQGPPASSPAYRFLPARTHARAKLSARRGEESGQNGGLGLSRADSRHSLSDLQMTSLGSHLTTKSNIFEFVTT
jgi:hypothetical protein